MGLGSSHPEQSTFLLRCIYCYLLLGTAPLKSLRGLQASTHHPCWAHRCWPLCRASFLSQIGAVFLEASPRKSTQHRAGGPEPRSVPGTQPPRGLTSHPRFALGPVSGGSCVWRDLVESQQPTNAVSPPQHAAVTWRRVASSCGRESTSARGTTSVSTGPAASAAISSSRARWCQPWARPTTPTASCAPRAGESGLLGCWCHSSSPLPPASSIHLPPYLFPLSSPLLSPSLLSPPSL